METGSGWIKGPAVYQPPRQASPNANSLEAFCGRAEAALLQRPALITPVCFRQTHAVIASAAKQSSDATGSGDALDCFVADRKSVVSGKSVSVGVDLGDGGNFKKKKNNQ